MSVVLLVVAATSLTILDATGLWLAKHNLPSFTLGDPIQPDGEDELDEETLRVYAATVQVATDGQSIGTLIRRRLLLSLAGIVLVLGALARALWLVQE